MPYTKPATAGFFVYLMFKFFLMKRLLLLLMIAGAKLSTAQCLTGTYTIGGTSPDYATIGSAVTALTTNGVCGPVTFNIRTGTYTGQVVLPAVTGTSAANTITFQSEALDSTLVTIQAAGASTTNYVIRLSGIDYVRFHKLKVKNTSTLYTTVFAFSTSSDNTEISSCIIENPLTTAAGSNRYQVSFTSTDNENFILRNCYLNGGSRAVNITGISATAGVQIRNNYFLNQYEGGVYLTTLNSPVVIGNNFNCSSSGLGYVAVTASSCNDSAVISNNLMNYTTGGYGISLVSCNGNAARNFLISNNRISGTTGNVSGISLNASSRISVLHNTVVSSGTSVAMYCFNAVNTNLNDIVKNNIFYQKGAGNVYGGSTGAVYTTDFNAVYGSGANFGFYNGTTYSNFLNWQSVAGKDNNSISSLPQFVSVSDLHIAGDFSQNLILPYFAEVALDLDGVTRDVSSPYFGAYEYFNVPVAVDAGVKMFTSPGTLNCTGSLPVKVQIKNFGTNTLTSANVNWTINGVTQPVFNWSGTLSFYDTTSVTIGTLNFSALGSYVVKAWTSNPNGTSDNYNGNDTITSPSLLSKLSGTYTIGGLSPSFSNIASAVTALNQRGLCGSVVFNIRAGTYNEGMTLGTIQGLSGSNTLTIQSESGINTSVNVSAPSGITFYINGADNITIKDISIGTPGVNANAINIVSGSNNIEINNCIISVGNSYHCISSTTTTGTVSELRIHNNSFNTGSHAYYLSGSSANRYLDVSIENNVINNIMGAGIYLYYIDTLSYVNNRITNSTPCNIINVSYAQVKNNLFSASDGTALSISLNTGLVANNMIILKGSFNATASVIASCQNLNFLNNSILCANTNSSSGAMNVSSMGGLNNRLWNNCVVNTGGGKVITVGSFSTQSIKKNAYFGAGVYFGSYAGTNVTSFSEWQTIALADTASIFANPFYTSQNDLHAHEILLKDAGADVSSYITDDYDAQLRSPQADIGADEFSVFPADAGINAFANGNVLCTGTSPVQVYLKNNGSSALTSATISYKVNAVLQASYSWSGSLAPGGQTLVTIGTYNFLPLTSYNLKAWSSVPNGVADPMNLNDTITRVFASSALSGTYTIGGTAPNFSTIGNAVTALRNGGVCGPVTFNIRNGIYSEQLRIQNIPGVSAVNTIRFQSESLDSSLVIIQYNSPSSALNYTIKVDTTDYVSFYKLSLKSLNSTYSSVIQFTNKATHGELRNCHIAGPSSGSGILAAFQANSDSTFVAACRFTNTGEALNLQGTYCRALNNYFEGQVNYGISGAGASIECRNNSFNYPSGFGGSAVSFVGTSTHGIINANRITIAGTGKGIYLSGGSTSGMIVSNNFISMNGGNGIYLTGAMNSKILHNSLWQQGNGYCLYVASATNPFLRNNIFYSSYPTVYSVYYGGGVVGLNSDHNCISNTGNMLISTSSMNYNDIAVYAGATGQDINSNSSDPFYISSVNLHTNANSLNAQAQFNALVPEDIDGEIRNTSNPDIGADEFTPVIITNDVQLLQLYFGSSACGGTGNLYAKIKNVGSDTLHSVQLSTVYRGVPNSPASWTGTLAQGAIKDSVLISNMSSLYGAGTLKGWVYSPNGLPDQNTLNDTLTGTSASLALNGIYTIGGASPDFTNLRLAANALRSYGICGNVTMNIRPGTYTDTLTLLSVAGTSSYSITFRSENSDSSSVIIQDYSTSPASMNYILLLKAAKNLVFEKLTFKQNIATDFPSGNFGIRLEGAVTDLRILNCRFIGLSVYNRAISSHTGNTLGTFQLKNSYFTNVGEGISLYWCNGITFDISNNTFSNSSFRNIQVSNFSGTIPGTIADNKIISTLTTGGVTGIDVSSTSCNINRNTILFKTGIGISANTGQRIISNNYIQIDSLTSSALNISNSSLSTQVVHNTVKAKIVNSAGSVMMLQSSSVNLAIKNNILINTGTIGRVLYLGSATTNAIDYNRYTSNSSTFAYFNSVSYSTFNSWKAASGNDVHSQNQPTFLASDPGYKVQGDPDLNATAIPIAGITHDIEGNLRNLTTPDIGAYEFEVDSVDAGIKGFIINDTALCSGSQVVNVTLRNYGTVPLTSAILNWKVNNITQPSYIFSGNIPAGDTSVVSIGTYNFTGGDRIRLDVFSSMPNGIPDPVGINDTLHTRVIKTRLSGTYTIGGSSPDFTTFKQATDTLQFYGVCGPVTFNMRNGTYSSGFTMNSVFGTSPVNMVTFQSESLDSSLVTIADNGVCLVLNGIRNFRFYKIGFVQNTHLNIPSVELLTQCRNIEFSNCSFDKPLGGVYGSIRMSNCDSLSGLITIRNNFFGGMANIVLSSGGNPSRGRNIIVSGNYFSSIEKNWIIDLDSVAYTNNYKGGLDLTGTNKMVNVSGNRIENADISVGTTIANFSHQRIFTNNIIDGGRLHVTNMPNAKIYHNTLISHSDYGSYYGCLAISGSLAQQEIRNNIFVNTNRGLLFYINDAAFAGSPVPGIFDHNVIYSAGDTVLYSNSTYSLITKAQWTGSYLQDQNSVGFNPVFTSATDFHPLNDHRINNIGQANTLVLTDFDGVTRDAIHPDPGAYEFNVISLPDDAGVADATLSYCEGINDPVNIKLRNYGNNTLTSVTINWSVDGVVQVPYNWTGMLVADSSAVITIGNYSPSLISGNDYVFFTSSPNGAVDPQMGNDTLLSQGVMSALNGTYMVGGATADFASFFDVAGALLQRGVCGPVEFVINPGTYPNPAFIASLNDIAGNSGMNTIEFRSQTGNASSVTIDFRQAGTGTGEFTLKNINGVIFRNVSFIGSYILGANANNVSFIGCRFNVTAPVGFSPAALISSSQFQKNVTFINNHFKGTNTIFNYTHASGAALYPENLLIRGNIFDGAYKGIEIRNVDSITIDSNQFYRTGGPVSNSYAIRLLGPKHHYEITRNLINGDFEKGVELGSKQSGSVMRNPLVANNVIIGTNNMFYGIYTNCDSSGIYYNSIDMKGTHLALYLSAGRCIIKNNILRSATGKLLHRTAFASLIQSDHNVFYTNGANVIQNNSTNYTSLAGYISATGSELNSSFRDPLFVSETSDLHYQNDTLDGTAQPLSLVIIDFAGNSRDALSPNPGAYETAADTVFDSINKSLVLKRIHNNTLALGNNALTATIHYTSPMHVDTNYYHYTGTIDSLRIHYKINHLPEVSETWTGALTFGDSLVYTFSTPLNVPNGKRYDIKVWFENINPLQEEIDLADDSLHKIYHLPMLGDYTIGGTTPDFTDYWATYFSLYYCGSSGDVRFLYRPGVYSEDIRYEENIAYPAHNGWIEYTSETGNADDVHVRLQWLDELDSMKFSKLTITPYTSNSFSTIDDGVQIGHPRLVMFDSCKFIGGAASNEKNGLFFYDQYNGFACSITNCLFKNLRFAVNLSSYPAYSSSGSYRDFIFDNNIIDSCDRGILIKKYNAWNKKLRISHNRINVSQTGIEVSLQGGQKVEIIDNYINAGQRGIYASATLYDAVISNNMVNCNYFNNISQADNLKLYNNTFNAPLTIYNPTDSLILYNNIFYTDSTYVALQLLYSNPIVIRSDNNDYFAPNSPYFARIGDMSIPWPYVIPQFSSIPGMSSVLGTDSNSVHFDPLFLSAADLHSQSANLKGLAKPLAFVTNDIDGESRLIDAPDIGADEINLIVTDVWPGDADKNNLVDNNDMLPIGLFYGQTGSPRASISNTWTSYPSMDWGIGQVSGYDIKHVDCNGDGTIDDNDTLAVNLNFSSSHAAPLISDDPVRLTSPPMYWLTGSTTYNGGDWVTADLYLGNSSAQVSSLYGIAFDVNYTSSLVQPGTENITYPSSWLANPGVDAIKFNMADPSANTAFGAITRIDHTNASGYGKIASYRFQLKNTIAAPTTLELNTFYTAVEANGDSVQFNVLPYTISVNPISTDLQEETLNSVTGIYPNPYVGSTTILVVLSEKSELSIEVYNAVGQMIQTLTNEPQSAGTYSYDFSAAKLGLDAGVYFVKIRIDGKTSMKRIVEMK
jgi:hypothetical protein